MEQAGPDRELNQYIEFVKGIFDHAPDSVSVADPARRLVYQNRTAARLIGCSVEEFNAAGGMSNLYVHPEVEEEILRGVASGRWWAGEVEVKGASGQVITALLKASGIVGSSGEFLGVLGIFSDISRQVEAREALERSEAYFRSLFENARDIIMVLDETGKMVYASPSFERVFGFRPDEVEGTMAFDYVHPDDLERMALIFRKGIGMPNRSLTTEYRSGTRTAAGVTWKPWGPISWRTPRWPASSSMPATSPSASGPSSSCRKRRSSTAIWWRTSGILSSFCQKKACPPSSARPSSASPGGAARSSSAGTWENSSTRTTSSPEGR